MKKKHEALMTLSLGAMGTAAVLVFMLGPDGQELEAQKAAQGRALAAAARAPLETKTAAAAAEKRVPAAAARPEVLEMMKQARMVAARREFLSDPVVWASPGKAVRVAALAKEYRDWLPFWIKMVMDPARRDHPDMLLYLRRESLDKELADRSQLTTEAKEKFDASEAQGWQEYTLLPHKESEWEPAPDKNEAVRAKAGKIVADVTARRGAAIRQYLDLLEWEGDTQRRTTLRSLDLRDAKGPEAEAARQQNMEAMKASWAQAYQFRLDLLKVLGEFETIRAQWQEQGVAPAAQASSSK